MQYCCICICRFLAHHVGSLRRTDSVAIEGIADIRRSLAARRSDANDPDRTQTWLAGCEIAPMPPDAASPMR